MRLLRSIASAIAALAIAAALPTAASAQLTITIEGTVRSTDGRPIPQAQVAVTNPATNARRGTVTNDDGRFRILGIEPGRYEILVRAIGHEPQTQTRELLVGQRANLLFELATAARELSAVAVTATRTTTTEVQRTSVSTPVVREMIEKLPTTDRNVMTLAATAPGIKSFSPTAGRGLPSAGAVPELRFINFYLDGIELKSLFNGNLVGIPQTGAPLPQESIQEFRVFLNPYDAEYSHAGAYVLSAESNRGTNETRGSVFGFYQNKEMTAKTVFQAVKPDFTRTQLGFNLRGPLQKDRLFYAVNYEVTDADNFIDVVPASNAVFGSYAGAYKAPNLNHTGFARLTFAPSEQHTFDGMWSVRYMTGESNFGGTVAREGGIDQSYFINVGQLRHRWLPRQNILNELSLQLVNWHHDEGQLVPGPQLTYPSLTFGTATFPLELNELHLRFIDRASYTIDDFFGSHVLKAGVELSRVNADQFSPNFQQGSFRFPTDATPGTGTPNQAIIGVGFPNAEGTGNALAELSGTIAGVYLNDEWRPMPTLTLNVGLRYDAELNTLNNDYTVPWASDPELTSKPQLDRFLNRGDRKNDLNNFSPRASFSWDPFGQNRTFIRGGAGIIYDRVASFIGFQERLAASWRSYTIANPGTMDVETLRQRVAAGTVASTPNIVLVKDKMEAPENRQYSLGFGHQITPDLAVNLDYIHQDVRHLYARLNANYRQGTATTATRVLTPRYGDIILWDDFAKAQYDAVVVAMAFRRPRLLTNLSYTLGFYEAEYDAVTAPAYAARDFYDMQRTIGDERHRLVLSEVATLPWNFELSAVGTIASPRPYVATLGQDVNNTNDFNDDFYTSPTGEHDALRTLRPSNSWENWYRNLDLRLGVPLYSRRGAAVRATVEVFNVFNTNNIAAFQGRLNNAAGAPLLVNGRPSFGTATSAFAARRMQAGLRAEF